MNNEERYDKPCVVCGEMMFGVARAKRFCDKCKVGRQRKQIADFQKNQYEQYFQKDRKTKKKQKEKPDDRNLVETARKAREKG